jgi:Ca2+-binding EF-hand superfamily protein
VAILCVTFAPAVAGPGSAAIPECKAGYLRLFQLTYADAAGRGRSGAGRRQLVVILGEEKDVTSKGIKSEDEWEGQVLNLRADADRSGIRSDWQAGLWLEVRSGTRLLGKSNLDLREIQGLLRCPAAPKVFELKLSRDGTDFCGSVSFKARFDPDDWTAPLATDSLHNDDIVRQEDQVPVVLLLSRISASELANTERFGFGGLNKQDPYVVASIGDTKAKTRALGGAGVDACWEGEELKLTISAKDASSGQLNLAIWNENLGSDALIGDGRVPLSDLALWTQESGGCQTKPKNISLQLTTAKGEKKGKISMQARCYAVADERAEADESVIRKLTVLEEMEGPGRTICRVLDAALERPLQNPSVTISFQPGSRSASTAPLFDSQMSTKETSHPVWEQQLLLPCYMMNYEAMGVDARLVVRISERSGLLGRAKVAGSGMLDVSEILQVREARKLAMNIYSDSDKRQPLGVINLELRFVGSWEVDDAKLGGELSAALDASDTDVPSPDVLSGADLPLCSPGNVRVHVLEAKELRVTEKDQDPYVVLDRKEGSFKTSVHKDAGSDAKWFESGDLRFNLSESHAAVGNPDSSAAVFRLQVKVMDHDDLSGDDLIADADLLVTRETLTTKQSSIGWHKLSYQGSDAGWIRLAFEWVPDPPVQIAVSTLRPEERVEEGTLFLVVESARELNGPNFMGRALDSPPSLEIELRPYEKHGRKMSKIAEARDGILEGVAIWQRFLKMNFVPVPRSVDKALADTPPTLILKVSCPIALGAKQSLGRAELPLAAIAKSDLVAEWQPVRKTLHLLSDDRSAGLLDVYTLYVPKALIEDKQAIAAVKRMRQDAEATLDMPRRSSPVEPPVPGYLDVHVIRGSSLHKVEKSQDPYVELKLICTTGAGTFCTPVAQDSADQPEWNSHFSILVDDASVETLDLWVKDGDNIGGRTSTIGRCKIPLRRFAAMSSVHDDDILQISPETFQLTDEKGKEFRGNVMLALHFRHEDDSLPARIMNCVCPGRSIQGSVQATIVSLGDLPNPPFSPSTGLHVEGCLTDCRQPESCLRTVKVGLETDSSGHLEIPWFSCGGDCRACDSPHISFNVYASGSSNSVYSSGNIPVDACLLGPNQNFHRVVQLRSTREGDISRSSTAFLQVILKFLPGSAPSSGSHSPVEKSEIDVAPGHLVVHCLRARNLPTVQQIGKQDPYLELIVQDNLHGPQNTVARTDPHTNGGRHPSWNQLHTLAIDDATSTRLLVRVLDDNSGTPMGDKLIGELQLSTAGLLNALQTAAAERQENGNDSNKMQMEGWFPIRKDHLSTGGEVRLCLEWLPRDFLLARSLVTGDELGESGPMGPYRYKLERKPGRLLVTVHRVVGLSKPILGQRSSVVEAVLKMPGSVGTKTRTQQQIGLNPDFEEQLAVDLLWTPQHTSCPEFALHVIDPGMGGGVLATGTLDLAPFILHPRMPADISCPLKGVESGAAVFCSVAYIPAASGRMSGAGIDPDLAQLAFAAYSGSVHVEVLSADGLPAGTKSPLATVRLRCANGPDSRSEWQDCICTDPKMGNTSPSFDKSLLFPISRGSVDKPGSGATPVLEIEICEGNANRKSHIGRIELPLLPLWLGLGHMTRTWYPISPKGRLYLGVQYISAGALSDSEPLAIVSSEPVILADVRQCNLIEAHASDLRCELEIVGTGSSATTGVAKEGAWSGQEGSLRLPLRGSGQQAATIMRITLLGQQKSRLGLSKGSNCIIGQCDWPISLSAVEGHRVEAQHTLFSGDKPTAEVLLGCRLDPNNEFKSNPVTAFAAPSLTGKYCISILKVSGSALGTSNLIWQAATACSTDPSFETELLLGNSQIAAVPASSIKGIDSEPAAVILRFYESQPANLVGTASISAEILQSLVLEKGHGSSEKHEQWLGVTLVDSAALNKGHIDKVLVDIAYCHSAVGVLEVTALEAQIVATALETDHMDMKRTRLRACCQLPPSAIWGNDPVNMRCSPLSYVHPVGPSDPVVNNPVIPSYDDGRSVLHSVCWAGYTPHRLRFFNSVAMCIPITLSMHVTPEGADISQAVCECAVPLDVLIEKLYAEVISESRQKLRKRRVLNEASPLVGSLDCDFSSIFEAWYPLSMVTSRSAPSETIGRARVAVRFAPHPATLEEDWVNDTPQSSWAEGAMAMKSLFYRIDRDGSGTIDSSELSACLKAAILEESASADLYGPGQGGAIDIRKLGGHSLAESGLRAAGKLLLGLSSSMGLSDNEDGDDDHIAALFQAMDTDLSGEISFTEYERFVTEAFSRISEAEKKGYVNQLIPDNADDPDPEPFAEEYEEALDVALGKKGEAKAISTEAPLAAPSNQLSFDRAAKAVDANIEAPKARLDLEEDLPTSAADEKQTTRPDSTLCTVLESQIPRQHLSAAPKSQMPKPPPNLPPNIKNWRTPHVVLWLERQAMLPQYGPAFTEAGVDGLVLLAVDDRILEQDLGVESKLHRLKICQHVAELKRSQDRLEMKENRDERDMGDLRRKVHTPTGRSRRRRTTARETSDDWHGQSPAPLENMDRVKLERMLRQRRREQLSEAQETDRRLQLWRYAYDGSPKPGSKVLTSASGREEILSKVRDDAQLAATGGPWPRKLPSNATSYEVLAVLKAAMSELGDVLLLETEEARLQRCDSDLGRTSCSDSGSSCDEGEGHLATSTPRMTLLYNAFVDLQNNGARWLGQSGKLTRLKLEGGISALLGLEMSWEQVR